MRCFLRLVILFLFILSVSGCSFFMPKPMTLGHIPPSLTSPRVVYGCEEIQNQLKLASCYLKTSEALYLANEDKASLANLESKWQG